MFLRKISLIVMSDSTTNHSSVQHFGVSCFNWFLSWFESFSRWSTDNFSPNFHYQFLLFFQFAVFLDPPIDKTRSHLLIEQEIFHNKFEMNMKWIVVFTLWNERIGNRQFHAKLERRLRWGAHARLHEHRNGSCNLRFNENRFCSSANEKKNMIKLWSRNDRQSRDEIKTKSFKRWQEQRWIETTRKS